MRVEQKGEKLGRPTKYKEEYCDQLISHMSKGFTYDSFAALCGVNLDTLYEWEKVHSCFSEAKKTARSKQLMANEQMIRDIAMGKIRNANATAAIFIMKNCHKWKDRHEVEIRDLSKLSIDQLKKDAQELLKELDESTD